MYDYFTTRDGAVYVENECELMLYKTNVVSLPNGDLEAFLFGALVIIHNDKKMEPHTLTLATKVTIPISSSEQIINDDKNEHIIIHFEPGDRIIKSIEVPATLDNVYNIFNDMLLGRLSNAIPYDKYYDIILKCMDLNTSLEFPYILLELYLAEAFLDSSYTKPARLQKTATNGKAASINDLVQVKGAFNSITFEDFSKSLLLNKGKSIKQQTAAPSLLEKYMRQ